MSKRSIKYKPGEIGGVRALKDFLPSSDTLVPREENVKVTLSMSRRSFDSSTRASKPHKVRPNFK